ncbi:hypothetical protein Tco_0556938 [Tanacetum coccineum]
METTVPRKEETFQVVIDLVKNSTCFKAFTISADVPEIFMQQFWYTIKKVQGTDSYEFILANNKCVVNADICPRVEGVNFTDVPDDDTTLAFLIKLGYKGPLYKHTNMFVDHMHQPWRTLAAIINKCLSRKTTSNDKLQLIWEDLVYQIDHRKEKRSRCENMPCYDALKMFIKYSTGQILPKKSKGKGSKRKKTAEDSQETIDVSEESEPEPESVKRRGSVFILGKPISQTEAEEAEAAIQVHATHARIVTESVPESAKKKSGSRIEVLRVKRTRGCRHYAGFEESKKTSKRQPGTGGSNEGTGSIPGVPMSPQSSLLPQNVKYSEEDKLETKRRTDKADVADEEGMIMSEMHQDANYLKMLKTESEEVNIYNYKTSCDGEVIDQPKDRCLKRLEAKDDANTVKDTIDTEINSLLEVKIQSEVPHTQSPSVLSVPVSVISKPTVLTLVQESPLIATATTLPPPSVSTTPFVPQQTTTLIPTITITTDAPIITTVVSEFDALYVVQLRVAKLEKDVSDLKKIDLSAEALAALKTQVPSVVDNHHGSKVGDVFQKEMKKHTADLIQKYSLQQIPELPKKQTAPVDLKQGSEKSASEILKIKREQAEKQQTPKFTIKSTDKAALQEYDLKSALYQSMHVNKSFNKNPANQRLYRALMEALIEDENIMDKGVADTVKDHKRKHDDDEDDDDEDPPARPNQGSKTGKSASAKEPVEEPIAEVVMDDAGDDVAHDDNQPQDTSKPKTRNTPNPKWFKQPPRPPTPDPEWNKHQVVLDQPKHPWFNQMVSATKDPLTFNDLMATPIHFFKYVLNGLKIENLTQDILLGPAFNLLKGTCSSSIELEYNFQECFNALTDKLDWNNPEEDRYPFDLSKPLPLQGPQGHRTVAVDYFFNNDLEYLKTSDLEVTYTTSITKIKAARYEIKGIEYMVPTLWSTIKHAYDKDADKGIKHWGERRKLWYRSQVSKFSKHNVYSTKAILGVKSVSVKKLHGYGHLEEIVVKRSYQQLYKFKEGDFVNLNLNDIEDMLLLVVQHKLFHLDGSDILAVESYQKKLNITKPQKTFPEIEFKEPYTPSYGPPRIVNKDLNKQKRVLRADKLYKFSDRTQVCLRGDSSNSTRLSSGLQHGDANEKVDGC